MNRVSWIKKSLAVAVIVAVAPGLLMAAQSTSNLSVTATVNTNCTISTAPLAFGSYDPVVTHATTDLDNTGTVTIRCTKGTVADITLGLGANASGSTRRMVGGVSGDFLAYEIYQDSGRTTVWGEGADKQTTPAAPNNGNQNYTAYGRITAGQDVSADSYTDTVVATVIF